ncbi:MAG: hypothetical protein R2712_15970 [Vicinamibacterales bacterium]
MTDPHRARRRLTLDDPDAAITPKGHAVECRIYAEDRTPGSCPRRGRIHGLRVPHGPGIRDDGGVYEGGEVPIFYDPMVSKLIAWGADRPAALARLGRALDDAVQGIRTTIPFFRWLLGDDDFRAGRFDTSFIDRTLAARAGARSRRRPVRRARRDCGGVRRAAPRR